MTESLVSAAESVAAAVPAQLANYEGAAGRDRTTSEHRLRTYQRELEGALRSIEHGERAALIAAVKKDDVTLLDREQDYHDAVARDDENQQYFLDHLRTARHYLLHKEVPAAQQYRRLRDALLSINRAIGSLARLKLREEERQQDRDRARRRAVRKAAAASATTADSLGLAAHGRGGPSIRPPLDHRTGLIYFQRQY